MENKTCVVTGASAGIGEVTALQLATRGARVVMVCRNQERGEAALARVREASGGREAHLVLGDLSLVADTRRVAAQIRARFDRLDVLVNNAGGIFGSREVTPEGFERTWALNHLSYFVLTTELLGALGHDGEARIVNVSSEAHRIGTLDFDDLQAERAYSQLRVYGTSKLANVLFTRELGRRLEGSGITANCLHPGTIRSNFGKTGKGAYRFLAQVARPFLRSVHSGARPSVHLATSPEVAGVTGAYFVRLRRKEPSKAARDPDTARRLWEVTEQMVGEVGG